MVGQRLLNDILRTPGSPPPLCLSYYTWTIEIAAQRTNAPTTYDNVTESF